MANVSWHGRGALTALLLAAVTIDKGTGFIPPSPPRGLTTRTSATFGRSVITQSRSFVAKPRSSRGAMTTLRMGADDFNEAKYTEAAWSIIASLTKAADYYEASTIEAPIMIDVLLNPSKHHAGDEAESARRVAEKVLGNSGVDVKLLRMELDKYLAKQAKLSGGSTQKTLGGILQKVLDNARVNQGVLGVSLLICLCACAMLYLRV